MKRFENLKRLVTVTDASIILSTQLLVDVQYAFYLSTPSEILKKYYIRDSFWEFLITIDYNKVYYADFFYKYNGEVERYTIAFSIDKKTQEVKLLGKKIICETAGHKIELYDQNSNITFIVFNGYGTHKKTKPFGLEFLLSQGFNVIACLHENNQYQSLSYDDFKVAVASYLDGKDVFLYGSSLGGYAAVYYSGAVNGVVIAAAPRNSAHPNFGKNNKFKNLIFTHTEIVENKKTSKNVYILIDDKNVEDVEFLNSFIIPAYPNVKLLIFPFAGHEVLYHVNATQQLKKIIKNIVEKKEIDIDFNIESVYTNLGKAKYFLEKNNIEMCFKYIDKCKNGILNAKIEREISLLLNACQKLV